jgi:hypothetical protein
MAVSSSLLFCFLVLSLPSLCLVIITYFSYFVSLTDNSVALVRERTIPTERPPLVGEVAANFLQTEGCRVASAADPLRP